MADALLLLHVSSAARSSPLSSSAFPLPSPLNPHRHELRRLPVGLSRRGRAQLTHVKAHAMIAKKDEPKWWEKNVGENMIDVNSPKELLDVLNQAGDRLVIVEFYNTWCASCRGLFPKLCKTAQEHPEITIAKVKFDENKSMCKRLNVRVLPYFHFYHGAEGLVEFFSCSLVQFQKIKDAIALHNTASRVTGPPLGVGDLDLFDGPYPTVPRGNSR